MTFKELKKVFEKEFQIIRLADIARELDVTPQVVNNWKLRNQVPYNYVKVLKKKLANENNEINEKIIINSSFFELVVKFIGENSKLISHVSKKLRLTLLLSFIFCIFIYLLGKYHFEHVYVASLNYVPVSEGNASKESSIMTLAERFGVPGSGQNSSSTSLLNWRMIPVILNSKLLSEKVIEKYFYSKKYNKKLKLFNIFNSQPDTTIKLNNSDKRAALKKLKSSISHSSGRDNVLKTISVSSFEPELCVNILNECVKELRIIFTNYFKEQNIDKKTFLNGRLSDTQKELTYSENELKLFREKNRDIYGSPELQTQQNRLMRDVTVLTEVYINLRSQYEMLLVSEKANIDIFKIIDSPEVPFQRVSPNNKKNVITVFIISFCFFNAFFVAQYYLRNNKVELKNAFLVLKDTVLH
jgi:hypothetical protein